MGGGCGLDYGKWVVLGAFDEVMVMDGLLRTGSGGEKCMQDDLRKFNLEHETTADCRPLEPVLPLAASERLRV